MSRRVPASLREAVEDLPHVLRQYLGAAMGHTLPGTWARSRTAPGPSLATRGRRGRGAVTAHRGEPLHP